MALHDAGLGLTTFYYFDFRNTTMQDVHGLLSSLLVQLCARSNPCYRILSRLYSNCDSGSQLPDDRALIKCLRDMLELPGQPVIYLIVDVLDECPNISSIFPPRERVLNLIEDLVKLHLEIFVSASPASLRLIWSTLFSLWHLILFLFMTKTAKGRTLTTISPLLSSQTERCENGEQTIRNWLLRHFRRGLMGCM